MAELPRRLKITPATQRYLVIGISIYLFELLIIIVAQGLGADNVLAVGISFWSGLIISFILQKIITFQDKRIHHKILLPQLTAFALLVVFNFGFTVTVTQILGSHLPPTITRTIALCITTIWNFYLYKTRIFKSNDNPVY
jgi:putative flippase GtrA